MQSPLFEDIRESKSVKNARTNPTGSYVDDSIPIPEFGLSWPVDKKYYALKDQGLEEKIDSYVFLIEDEKKWLLTVIKYGYY
jgi:hypothetical protein